MMTATHAPYRTSPFALDEEPSDDSLTVPFEGQTHMRLLFGAGVSDLTLRVSATESALIRGRFHGLVPRVHVASDEVSIRYRFGLSEWLGGVLTGRGVGATLVLHPGVSWELVFRGGASEIDADLRNGRFTGLDVSGGASEVHLTLPTPDGIIPLRFRGGASELAVRRPANVPVGVRIRGGVASLEIDGKQIGAAGGPLSLDSDGWSTAPARYDVELAGGASDVSVST